jgi:hypothetical protein
MAEVMKETDERLESENEEIVIVEEKPQEQEIEDDDSGDDRVAKQEEDDGNDPEREAIRERRRLEKLERKERRDKAITRDKVELDFLRKRNDELERRMSAQEQRAFESDLSQIDAQIARAVNEAQMADRVIAKAVEVGNGDDVTKAMRYRDEAIAKANQLNQQKQQATQRPPQPQQAMDDRAMLYAKEFLEENKWYDPQGGDERSAIVLAIDQAMNKEGHDPRSEDYWDELRARVARRLPEQFGKAPAKAEREERVARGGPTVGSGREHAPASTRKEIYISPDRKQALVDAGVWDDPVLRMKYVKRYAEYDRNNKS